MNLSEYTTQREQSQQLIKNVNISTYETRNATLSRKAANSLHILPRFHTPPSGLKKVVNPFESTADRLHLPLICSPSLFEPPDTPKNSTIQFEWTIDDVSSLAPADVVPHETQFIEQSPDPELEERAQAAIRSYFKQQLVVPSPRESDCCRETNNFSKELLTTTKHSSLRNISSERYRNVITQTKLSLPPKLPIEVEKVLRKYNISNENFNKTENFTDESVIMVDCNILEGDHFCDISNKEVSRRLFDDSVLKMDDDNITTPKKFTLTSGENIKQSSVDTPEMNTMPMTARNSGNLLDHNISFGAISPIPDVLSPVNEFLYNIGEISPAQTSNPKSKFLLLTAHNPAECRSAQYNNLLTPSLLTMNMSIDVSFNRIFDNQSVKKGELKEQSQKSLLSEYNSSNILRKAKSFSEMITDKVILSRSYDDENRVQAISLSTRSLCSFKDSFKSDLSSSQLYSVAKHPETPIRKRYPNRKNLSHSFSCYSADDNERNNKENEIIENQYITFNKKFNMIPEILKTVKVSPSPLSSSYIDDSDKKLFVRADSGFTEMTCCIMQDESKFTADLKKRCGLDNFIFENNVECLPVENEKSVFSRTSNRSPMRCCSTPSKH